ncbi:hypothetical protein OG948_54775 (plasmid) [Embleya sp. NBC_00888]|uniref:hypothetical protein n=1 Tax=Embleya sp. NBC_00888 TaxID=2975960 RepID=UPI002F916EA2|nr:hypothetical protein OG948_54775 [Embleya sp. NBC_00888]
MTGDHGEAEDLAQTAFARVGASWARVRAVEQRVRTCAGSRQLRYQPVSPVAPSGLVRHAHARCAGP